MGEAVVRAAGFDELDARTLYALLALRVDVFVVEQSCPYPELDGRDLEPGTRHLWVEGGGAVLAYLRTLRQPGGGARIGRVVTAAPARGRGLAALLVRAALAEVGPAGVDLHAQAHLVGWYAAFGFEPAGAAFLEDGIPHVPMRRAPAPP